ncbi:polysaccharide deacetylase family protein [Halobium palmae]|uniref:Polysaccharide deacetylase family protein n=1 Tax=Halobium palmae TaxID=1776492 RepID=A0ABD5RX64_9EURY
MNQPTVVTERASFVETATPAPPGARVPVEVRVSVGDPFEAYRRARDPDADGVFLETTGDQSGWGYFGVDPVERLQVGADAEPEEESPTVRAIDALLDREELVRGNCEVPYPCGAFGWLSYDVARELEDLPETTVADGLPRLQLGVFDRIAAWEAPTDGWYHVTLALRDASGDCVRYTQTVEAQYLNDWHRLDLGMHSEIGDPDLSAITSLDLMTWVGGNPSRVSLGDLRSTPTADVGYVMFTFDDIPESTYTAAYPAMREHGFVGCGGAIKEWVGGPGTMSMRQLDDLAAEGWEFCSHPQYDELPIPEMDLDRLRRTLVEYKRWLLDHGFDRGAETIIYPYGVVDDAALEVVADYHELGFKLQRGQYGPSVTSPLLAGRTDGDHPRLVRRAVDRAAKYGLAVPLMYHKIGTEDRISKADFEATVEYVANVDGVRVVTPGEYLAELKNGTL